MSNTWHSEDFISNQNVTHKCDFNKCISEVLEFFQLYLLYGNRFENMLAIL